MSINKIKLNILIIFFKIISIDINIFLLIEYKKVKRDNFIK